MLNGVGKNAQTHYIFRACLIINVNVRAVSRRADFCLWWRSYAVHNDRRASGNMSTTGRSDGIFSDNWHMLIFNLKSNRLIWARFNNIRLQLHRISWPLFALLLSRVHQVHSFVICRNPSQAMRPWRQHLLLNKLLTSMSFNYCVRYVKNAWFSHYSVANPGQMT